MRATETEGVELASYRLKGVAYSWFEMWEDSREEWSPPTRWSEFADAFIDHFLPAETKVARVVEFETLKVGSKSVWEYHMEFVRLSKYDVHMMPTMEARVRRFLQGLSPLVINEAATSALNSDMNYGKMVAFAQATEARKLKHRMERKAQSSSPTAATSSTHPLARGSSAPAGRGTTRGGAQSSGGPSRFYAMSGRHSVEAFPDVVTSILTVQSHDVYALIDPGSSLSYVTPYVATSFGIEPEQLHEPFSVSIPVGEYITAARVYRDCVVTVRGRDTMADLIELGMIDFDVIMGMDWLNSCFAKLDCRTRIMRLEFPNEPTVEWERNNVMLKCHAVSGEGIKVDPQKIATVKDWPRPTTLTEIHRFLGLVGYYRMFVEGFSTLASPLTKLTQKAVKFQWSDACEMSFQELKSRLTSASVKAENQKPGGLAQSIEIPLWKWEMINMDFVVGLPRTPQQYAQLYIKEIVRLHGTLVSIISDRGAQFTANIWKKFQQGLGTLVNLSTAFHPQTNGQAERTIQTLEDMLRPKVEEQTNYIRKGIMAKPESRRSNLGSRE
ncbi:uncharacterized protein [Nicotiana tomentosiformis]|uniref:uncharacterized protein n=1 Tax=Nicotiana tomentosiformis TaxID=4098 RepID=UPI00388C3E46